MSLAITVLDHLLAAVGLFVIAYRLALRTLEVAPRPSVPVWTSRRSKVYRIVTDRGVAHYDGRDKAEARMVWESVELNPGPTGWTFTIDGKKLARVEARG